MNELRAVTTMETHSALPRLDKSALVAYLATQPDIVAAYLFGSLATGRATPHSDVDIAILLKQPTPQFRLDQATEDEVLALGERRLQLISAVASFANCEVDVVFLNQAPTLLQHEVLRCRHLLYEADRIARIDFEVRAGKMYADEQPMRDFFTQVMFKEIEEGRFGKRRSRRARTPEISQK